MATLFHRDRAAECRHLLRDAQLTYQRMQGIENALRRLGEGQFGVCSDCGRRLPAALLRTLPFAPLCLVCQQQHDVGAAAAARTAIASPGH